jgi:hypothetical protein
MADISFTPTFHHVEFVDGKDVVRAGEPNGFNARFHAIENDLDQLSTVVAEVDGALNQAVVPAQQVLTLAPEFVGNVGTQNPWVIDATGGASMDPSSQPFTSTDGVLNLILPNGSQLLSFRALGSSSGRPVSITLSRVGIPSTGNPAALVSLTGTTSPFDSQQTIPPGSITLDTAKFRYLVTARVTPAQAGDRASITALQVTYSLPSPA